MTALQAVLWDMDGTLVDTEPYWISAETELINSHGGHWSHEDALQLVGKGLWDSAEIIRAAGVDLSADEIVYTLSDEVRRQLREQGIPWQPGARELLAELRDAGVPTALVTMSLREMALEVAENAGFDAFDIVIAGDDVAEPKPHPAPYLAGIEALGIDASRAVGIEDSLTGLSSARAAGLAAIGVPHMISLDGGDAHVVWSTLAGKHIADLQGVLERVHG
ncbi:MAG: HAD family hydrolase [Agromyces sp.]